MSVRFDERNVLANFIRVRQFARDRQRNRNVFFHGKPCPELVEWVASRMLSTTLVATALPIKPRQRTTAPTVII